MHIARSVVILCLIFLLCIDLSYEQYDYNYEYDDKDDGLTPAPRTRPPRPPRRRPSGRRDRGRDRNRDRDKERVERERASREREAREREAREREARERESRERGAREREAREREAREREAREREASERQAREREAREREARERETREREAREREAREREAREREAREREDRERDTGRASTRDQRGRDRINERDRSRGRQTPRPVQTPSPRPTRPPRSQPRVQTNSCGCPNDIEYTISNLNEFVTTTSNENERTFERLDKAEQEIRELRGLISKLNDQSVQWKNSLRFPGLSVLNAPNNIALTDDGVMTDQTFRDCQDVLDKGYSQRGIYNLNPDNSAYVSMSFCQDGWTIIQRRFDGSTDFYRTYDDYIDGFGNFTGEFWLGLEIVHQLSVQDEYTLRIDLESHSGKFYFAVYSGFQVMDEEKDYMLDYINMTSGSGRDGLKPNKRKGFSTRDHDRDSWRYKSCARHYKSGFWLDRCGSDLNRDPSKGIYGGTKWGGRYMKSSLMRIKPSKAMRRKDYRANP